MSLQDIVKIAAPPVVRLEAPTLQQWQAVESRLQTVLPDDYREFCMAYGTGVFRDPGIYFRVLNPFSKGYKFHLETNCQVVESINNHYPDRFPFYPFPAQPGLLPLCRDAFGNAFFYLTEGKPHVWPIIECTRESEHQMFSDLSMSTFLSKVFTGGLACLSWEGSYFEDVGKITFTPEEA
jgi:hypothetical protein